jgi:hypothetical protein
MGFIFSLILSIANAGSLCNDGTVSSSSGRGTCSHHGGVSGGYTSSFDYGNSYHPSSQTSLQTPTITNPYDVSSVGKWEHDQGVNDFGQVFHSLSRDVFEGTSDHHQFSSFTYTCYPTNLNNYEPQVLVFLVLAQSDNKYGDYGPISIGKSQNDSVRVFAVKGNKAEYISNWTLIVKNGAISLLKATTNMNMGPTDIEDLTADDVLKFLYSDQLYVQVVSSDGETHHYKIPMNGSALEIKNTINACLTK